MVYHAYQSQQLRARLAEVERASLASALHDGLLQSLIAIEMQVQALRARRLRRSSLPSSDLLHIERALHHEIIGVRDIMQTLTPLCVAADELLDFIADQVHRFELDTGIRIRFAVDVDVERVTLSTRRCTELARLIREALANVRKHSGARNVSVRLAENSGHWSFVVEDDGRGLKNVASAQGLDLCPPGSTRGFDSHGTTSRYPTLAVIRACVQALDGTFRLRPANSGGLRLEVTFPGPLGPNRVEGAEPVQSAPSKGKTVGAGGDAARILSTKRKMARATIGSIGSSSGRNRKRKSS